MLARRCGQTSSGKGGKLLQTCYYNDTSTGVNIIREISLDQFVKLEEKGPQSLFLLIKSSLFRYDSHGYKIPYACRRHGRGAHGFYRKGNHIEVHANEEIEERDTHAKVKNCIMNALSAIPEIHLIYQNEYGLEDRVTCFIDRIEKHPLVTINGQTYSPDMKIILKKTIPSNVARKWGGYIYLELDVGHPIPKDKSLDFCKANFPLFEKKVPREFLSEGRYPKTEDILKMLENQGGMIKVQMHWQPTCLSFCVSANGNLYSRTDGKCVTVFESKYHPGTYGVWSEVTGFSFRFGNEPIRSWEEAKKYATFLTIRSRMLTHLGL